MSMNMNTNEEESGLFFQVYEKKVIGSHRGSWEKHRIAFYV